MYEGKCKGLIHELGLKHSEPLLHIVICVAAMQDLARIIVGVHAEYVVAYGLLLSAVN